MRKKDYIVTIIAKDYKQEVETNAECKKEALEMVNNVLLGCDLFGFKNKEQYKLKIRRKRWSDK